MMEALKLNTERDEERYFKSEADNEFENHDVEVVSVADTLPENIFKVTSPFEISDVLIKTPSQVTPVKVTDLSVSTGSSEEKVVGRDDYSFYPNVDPAQLGQKIKPQKKETIKANLKKVKSFGPSKMDTDVEKFIDW